MSKTICVTVVDGFGDRHTYTVSGGILLETVLEQLHIEGSFCNGVSVCGRCKVRFVKGVPSLSAKERKVFTPQQLESGFRLACQAKLLEDCEVELLFAKEQEMTVVSDALQHQENKSLQEKDTQCPEADETLEKRVFAVADIGTTTIVVQLVDFLTGAVIDSFSGMNPQRKFGMDVISRIQEAKEHGEQMREEVESMVYGAIRDMCRDAGAFKGAELLCVTGNTTMLHILMGYDTTGLGRAPFEPVSLACEEVTKYGIKTVFMPGISAFVGADIGAGILATGMQNREEMSLLLDLGTNGEMALGNRDGIVACATAAGPAFESGAEDGVYASDLIRQIATLLEQEIIEKSGYLDENKLRKKKRQSVPVTQQKIRDIQLAKGAVRAGIEILLQKKNITQEKISQVYIAGGFGFFLDKDSAAMIGLLPEGMTEKSVPIGNSALAGARLFAKKYMENKEEALQMMRMDQIKCFNLAKEADFEDWFIQYIPF